MKRLPMFAKQGASYRRVSHPVNRRRAEAVSGWRRDIVAILLFAMRDSHSGGTFGFVLLEKELRKSLNFYARYVSLIVVLRLHSPLVVSCAAFAE